MKVDVVMPKMGESLQEGTITKWLKKVGDVVERDEMILEISTDKVDTEVPSPVSGILAKILFNENETIEVGKVIAEIETESTGVVVTEPVKSEPVSTTEIKKHELAPIEEPVPAPIDVPVVSKAAPEPIIATVSENMVDVSMPKMGESLQEGTITKWLKKVGDVVERDEMILEISTDKVDTEVPSPVGGVLAEILVQENQTVEVGSVIARISTGASAVSVPPSPPEKVPEVVKQATVQKAPEIVESKPATAILPVTVTKEIPRSDGKNFFSPLVRTIAEAEGVTLEELQTIQGSGAGGRISKQDLLNYIEKRKSSPPPSTVKVETKPVSPQIDAKVVQQKVIESATPAISKVPVPLTGEDEIIQMDRVRSLIAEHMVYSVHTSAHVTSVHEADVTNIVKYRDKHKDEFEKREGFKLTYTPFFAKAAIDGLKAYPRVNVSVDEKKIIQHKRINLGFATVLPDGNLIVPVIKNSDSLSMSGLARSVYDLSVRARNKKLNPDDIQGGTFTITNYGIFGTLFGTPIINQPETAIMGVGAIQKRPVVREINGEHLIVIRDMAYISLVFDHRVVDGQLAGLTLSAIVKSIESMNEENIEI